MMSIETAHTILFIIAGVALVVWLLGIHCVRTAALQARKPDESDTSRFFTTDDLKGEWHFGSSTVEGEPSELNRKAAASLAGQNNAAMTPLKIVRKTDHELVFEAGAAAIHNTQRNDWGIQSGIMHFTSLGGNSSRIDYAIDLTGFRKLLMIAWLIMGIGLIALVGGFLLLFFLAAPSQTPGVRGQVFQMCQAIHFLWPPFLLVWLYRRARRSVIARADAFVTNLPFVESAK